MCVYVCVCVCVCVWICVCICIYVCVCVYVHVYMTGMYICPRWCIGKEPTCQCRRQKRHRFYSWIRRIPWRKTWQLTPVFLPAESQGERSLLGYKSMRFQRVGLN